MTRGERSDHESDELDESFYCAGAAFVRLVKFVVETTNELSCLMRIDHESNKSNEYFLCADAAFVGFVKFVVDNINVGGKKN